MTLQLQYLHRKFPGLVGAMLLGLGASLAAPAVVAQQLGSEDASFFLTRTGFTPNLAEIGAYQNLTKQQAVDRVLQQTVTVAGNPPPLTIQQSFYGPREYKDKNEAEKKIIRDLETKQAFELRGWWLREMLVTPTPLTERMTLFWHNHFVSSQQKIRHTKLMYNQNVLFRQYAVGNFGDMLHAVSKDPAMLIYLDSATNRKGTPNENFAREVMELFTLGEGHYTEQDVKEAARAFTGWSVDGDTAEFRARPNLHDSDSKQVLGQSGNFDGDAVLNILLAQPACAEFIVDKLWKEFVSPTPDPMEVKRIAAKFRDSHYEIKVAMHELLLTPTFWSAANRGSLVKSPVEMLVGAVKQFQFHYEDPLPFSFAVAQLGQNLFNPPNVKGWPGGEVWINSTTLLARKSVLERLFRTVEIGKPQMGGIGATGMQPVAMNDMKPAAKATVGKEQMEALGKVQGQAALGREGRIQFANAASVISFNPAIFLAQYGNTPDMPPTPRQRLDIQHAVLPLEPSAAINSELAGIAYLRMLVMDPVYQLK